MKFKSEEGRNTVEKWGGKAILAGLTLGAAALLIRTAGGIASLLKRTKRVHLNVDVDAGKEGERSPSKES